MSDAGGMSGGVMSCCLADFARLSLAPVTRTPPCGVGTRAGTWVEAKKRVCIHISLTFRAPACHVSRQKSFELGGWVGQAPLSK